MKPSTSRKIALLEIALGIFAIKGAIESDKNITRIGLYAAGGWLFIGSYYNINQRIKILPLMHVV